MTKKLTRCVWGFRGEFRGGLRGDGGHRQEEAISMFRESLDKPGFFRRVAQSISQLLDRGVQAVIEGTECVLRPKSLTQLVSRNDFAGVLQQQRKQPERLFLQLYLDAFLVQLSRTEINSKVAEAHEPPAWSGSIHRRSEWMGAVYHVEGKKNIRCSRVARQRNFSGSPPD